MCTENMKQKFVNHTACMLQQLEPHCSYTSILNTETLTNSQDQNCISETPILVERYSNPWYMLFISYHIKLYFHTKTNIKIRK